MHDALYRGQTNTGALELLSGMKALKWTEQFVDVGHVKSCAIVTHKIYRLLAGAQDANLNMRGGMALGKLPGITEEIFQRDLQQMRIALNDHRIVNGTRHDPRRLRLTQPLDDLPGHLA